MKKTFIKDCRSKAFWYIYICIVYIINKIPLATAGRYNIKYVSIIGLKWKKNCRLFILLCEYNIIVTRNIKKCRYYQYWYTCYIPIYIIMDFNYKGHIMGSVRDRIFHFIPLFYRDDFRISNVSTYNIICYILLLSTLCIYMRYTISKMLYTYLYIV